MAHANGVRSTLAMLAMLALCAVRASAQASYPPPNDLPNPYGPGEKWGQLPDGRKWGSTSSIVVAADGNVWTYERCGGNSCAGSELAPILEFDSSGKALKSFGAGTFLFPHGLFVDKDRNVWVTDGVGGAATHDDAGKHGQGHQVFKLSPDGKLLMTLGKAGMPGDGPDTFNRPAAVIVAANGDIFVADGHSIPPDGTSNARIVKFNKNGKFIKTWGKKGSAPGEFEGPHTLAFDSKGRLFVGDRSNNRIQIFNQNGKFIAAWTQFGRPSGVFIDKNDTLYVTDSESREEEGYGHNPGCKRGIRIGSARTGKVTAFIPDPAPGGDTSGAEGVVADGDGNVYGAEVGPKDVKKYTKK